jgi:hypothetical protein
MLTVAVTGAGVGGTTIGAGQHPRIVSLVMVDSLG